MVLLNNRVTVGRAVALLTVVSLTGMCTGAPAAHVDESKDLLPPVSTISCLNRFSITATRAVVTNDRDANITEVGPATGPIPAAKGRRRSRRPPPRSSRRLAGPAGPGAAAPPPLNPQRVKVKLWR